MNYLAHAIGLLNEPYVLAGAAVPDWLSVADRRVRVRTKHAAAFVDDQDVRLRDVARGIVRHHRDDSWFHETTAFSELSWRLTVLFRDALPGDEGFRPSFLGHIVVEMLLDAVLTAEHPGRLKAYYRALEEVDPSAVQAAVNRMAPRPTERLAELIPLFCREAFLWDYADDGKLWRRLNQVMCRVGLPALPEGIRDLLPEARSLVTSRAEELLAAPLA